MQWLALRLRFIEELPSSKEDAKEKGTTRKGEWKEYTKVGEVVEEMRRLGREKWVVETGIGSAGAGK